MDSPGIDANQPSTNQTWVDQFVMHNWETRRGKALFVCRLILIISALIFCIYNAATGLALPFGRVECMWDGLHWWTESANLYFQEHSTERDAIVIATSLIIDTLLFNFAYRYTLWGCTWRPFVFVMLFYGFRTFCQAIFLMRYPDGLTWSYPGFPSVVVPYVNSSDFFFSGHLGILTFLLLENRESKDTLMTWVSVVSIAFEFWMMVVLRAHYTIDLISGVVFELPECV